MVVGLRFRRRGDAGRTTALYLTVAFGWAWVFWLLGWLVFRKVLDLPLLPLLFAGSFGPFVGAAVTTLVEGGPGHALRFFARVFDVRMGWLVFAVSFFLIPLIAVAVEYAHAGLTNVAPKVDLDWRSLPMDYLFLFVLGGTLAEEFGWSLLSDKLDAVLPLGRSTFVLGVIWAVWHLPLFFIINPQMVQGYTPFYIFLFVTVSMRFLFAWAYHRGGYNILSNMLFHTASNLAYSIVVLAPAPGAMSTTKLRMFGAATLLSAVVLRTAFPIKSQGRPPEAPI